VAAVGSSSTARAPKRTWPPASSVAVVTSLAVCSHAGHTVEFVVSLGLGIRLGRSVRVRPFLSDPKKNSESVVLSLFLSDPKRNELLFEYFI
jgi:hypothetical protein